VAVVVLKVDVQEEVDSGVLYGGGLASVAVFVAVLLSEVLIVDDSEGVVVIVIVVMLITAV
jgi:formaldehyde-activating enzyme involved in methanogenesis